MSFRSIVRDVRDGFGSLSRRSFEVRLSGHHRGKSQGAVHEVHDQPVVIQHSRWASLPPELLRDVIKRLEESESTWPSRKNVVACAAVCRSWREMCKEIVQGPEFCGKLTFPVSLKQPGPRDGTIQCFIKRDKSNLTYHLCLSLSPDRGEAHVYDELEFESNGGVCMLAVFVLSCLSVSLYGSHYVNYYYHGIQPYIAAERALMFTAVELSSFSFSPFLALFLYGLMWFKCFLLSGLLVETGKFLSLPKGIAELLALSMSNFLGTKFIIYDTQPPYSGAMVSQPGKTSRRFYSKKVSPKVPTGSYNIAQVTYELNVLGTRGPRRMHCTMYSIPASSLEPGGSVPGQPELLPRSLEDSFRSISFSKAIDQSGEFSSARFSDIVGPHDDEGESKDRPLVLRNKAPRWHEQLQCWCLNFRGRVTVASVKNFQLIAATQPPAGAPTPSQPAPPEHDKVILQFGKVGKDMFTMDYRYPLSAFQAFAICLSSFDTKLACE
ncbi:hypothetical protein Syun_013784 [Stephania yunnanensis]|uniref:Tubby-like F-box protein n=1 Tax=Stephania yunnanensis TaxID=152371 RepID=A0AAP0P8Z6_9MAGN